MDGDIYLGYGIVSLVKTTPFCRGMGWLPFQKEIQGVLFLLERIIFIFFQRKSLAKYFEKN